MIDMRDRGYVQDLPDVPIDQQFMNGLEACVRDVQCAYWD
jgi:hypothetical protein